MKAKKRNMVSDTESLHTYCRNKPMEMGPVPYDNDFDIGPNGIYANLQKLSINGTYYTNGFSKYPLFKDINEFDGGNLAF